MKTLEGVLFEAVESYRQGSQHELLEYHLAKVVRRHFLVLPRQQVVRRIELGRLLLYPSHQVETKLGRIKALRTMTGMDVEEAKAWVEKSFTDNGYGDPL